MKHLLTFLCLVFLHSSLSHAALTINIVETEGGVVATTSGSVNTDELSHIGLVFRSSGSYIEGSERFVVLDSSIGIGPPTNVKAYTTRELVTDMIFSTSSVLTLATSYTGASADYFHIDSRSDRADRIYLSTVYVPNSPINATATWLGATFASLELLPGTYSTKLGSGATDTLTIIIGTVVDTTDPTLLSSTPADNATGVSITGAILSFVFDEPVFSQSGLITIHKTSDDSQVNSRSVSGSTGSGTANISIGFENDLELDTEYYVLIPAGAFADAAGNPYAGISSTTELSFTTAAPAPTYSVEGTVSGLTALGLVLQNNGVDPLAIAADGPFTFATELADSAAYVVTVSTQPAGQTCSISNASGTIDTGDVTNVDVTCINDVVPPVEPTPPAAPVPAMSKWALILFTMLLGLMVVINRRRLF